MRKLYLILITFGVLTACQNRQADNSSQPKPVSKTYDEIVAEQLATNSKNDTIFLDFVLGSSRVATEKNFKRLIALHKIEPETTWEWRDLNKRIRGYPYTLQLNDSSACNCLISESYFGEKLYGLSIFFGACNGDSVKNFLTGIYGSPVPGPADEGSRTSYWIKGNKQITVNFVGIEFTDLRLKMLDEKIKREKGKDQANKTKTDFK